MAHATKLFFAPRPPSTSLTSDAFSYLSYRQALSFSDITKVSKGWTFVRKGRVTSQGSMFEIVLQEDNPQTISTCLVKDAPLSCIRRSECDFLAEVTERPRLTQGLPLINPPSPPDHLLPPTRGCREVLILNYCQ